MASVFGSLTKIPELRKRILFTIMMLGIYRIGVFVTVPGVDREVVDKFFGSSSGSLFSLFNMFSGGALRQMSIFALGIMPYISSSIIFQLLAVVIPSLERLQKEGEMGRRKITQYTRYGTIVLAIVQGFGVALWLESQRTNLGEALVPDAGWGFRMMTIMSLAAGTAFIMWLGEQITERGIGNGISLIITAGIVAALPDALFQTFTYLQKGVMKPFTVLVILVLAVAVIAVIVFFERGQRRIPVQYARRVVGRKMYGGQSTHLPLKVNTSGVIPPIFASSILLFPATLANFIDKPWMQDIQAALQPDSWTYTVLYVVLIVFFCYFYTAVTFNPIDVADNMKKYGGYIPGIRPGKQTAVYIDKVLSRITFGGALYISAVCVLPTLMIAQFNVPFYFGGTSLLIVVGVSLDTVSQIETHLITRHYDGLTGPKGPRIRGRSSRG
ncbi:MAG TPA: preprotein translocase subunit SecY [Myxococcota bacterium]|nr:preprotein translocase subunit SecY [Myxococcota bacterium]HRY94447.1 preprotein translocase subunit SecY [Myxococcota bacterium]